MVDEIVEKQVYEHVNEHGGDHKDWYVGIEEEESDRDDYGNIHGVRFKMDSNEDAEETWMWLVGSGFMDGGEHGDDPYWLFIYTED